MTEKQLEKYECKGQMTIFDLQAPPEETIEEVHAKKPWARACNGKESECFEKPENGICTSYWKCSRRMEYKSLNTYYMEQLNGARTLNNPADGSTILCEENKAKADELIKKTKEVFGFE